MGKKYVLELTFELEGDAYDTDMIACECFLEDVLYEMQKKYKNIVSHCIDATDLAGEL